MKRVNNAINVEEGNDYPKNNSSMETYPRLYNSTRKISHEGERKIYQTFENLKIVNESLEKTKRNEQKHGRVETLCERSFIHILSAILFCNVENNTNFHFTAKTRFPASFIVIVVVVVVVVVIVVAFFFLQVAFVSFRLCR